MYLFAELKTYAHVFSSITTLMLHLALIALGNLSGCCHHCQRLVLPGHLRKNGIFDKEKSETRLI